LPYAALQFPRSDTLVPGTKILIVDDEDIVLHFATDALSTIGCAVSATTKPSEALKLMESEKFDFLLTDIRMPDMDGIALARKSLELDPELGVIFMTGYADVDTAKKAIAAGAYDYVMKPFELPEIRHSVTTAVLKRREFQEKQGSKSLSQLSDLTGSLYTVGDCRSMLKLILGFALFHLGLAEGLVVYYDRKAKSARIISTENIRQSSFFEAEDQCLCPISADVMALTEVQHAGILEAHPVFAQIFCDTQSADIRKQVLKQQGHFLSFSSPATANSKLILTMKSEREFTLKEVDRQLMTVLLSMSSISLDNIALFEEARSAMAHLEDLKDRLVGLERAATQGMMSSEIAHELNNFIAIVASNIELFEMKSQGQYPPESAKYLENVKRNLARFENFTKSLSDAGKMVTNRQMADLNGMIREIATFATHQRRFRLIKLETDLDATLPEIYIDTAQMQQLIYNLMNNAGDAIGLERADGRISICTKYDAAQEVLELTATDNGIGFAPDNLKKAFRERFTTKQHGHGFGLTVCRKIIANHGGKVVVESQEGEGATIRITIPLAQPKTDHPDNVASTECKPA
jgi:signal transduction histidine kinase/CheY-like chemotaxis protein